MSSELLSGSSLFVPSGRHQVGHRVESGGPAFGHPPRDEPFHVVIGSTGMVDLPTNAGGGVEAYVWDLARILGHAGHMVTVVSNLREGSERPREFDLAESGSFVDRFPLPPFTSALAHGIGGSFTALATRRYFTGNGAHPTVLHLNEEVSSTLLCRGLRDVPKVFTLHNPPPVGPERSYGILERTVRWVNSSVCRRLVWKEVDVILALSSWIRGFLIDNGVPPERVVHLPVPIDTGRYLPSAAGPDSDPPYLLYVGRLDARKNVLRLVRAMGRPSGGTKLVLVGSGPAESAVRELIRREDLGDRVELPGKLPLDQLVRRFQGATAFCLPSTLEAYPRVVLEAAACGVPAVLPESFLYTDFFAEGFVESYDPSTEGGLESALERIVADPARRAALGKRARAYAERTTSYASFRAGLESAYRTAFEVHAAR